MTIGHPTTHPSDHPSPDFLTAPWQAVQQELATAGSSGTARRAAAYPRFFSRFGDGVIIAEQCHFSHPEHIELHDDCRINIGALIYGSGGVSIGRHTRIGPRVFIHSANHDVSENNPKAFYERGYIYERVVIGDNCLISANVSILPGVVLGDGCFVAAGAVVPRGTYPPGSRLAGVPARNMREVRAPITGTPTKTFRTGLARATHALSKCRGIIQTRVDEFESSNSDSECLNVSLAGGAAWSVSAGELAAEQASIVLAWRDPNGSVRRARIPASFREQWAPSVDKQLPLIENAAEIIWYFAITRLAKSPVQSRFAAHREGHIAARFLRRSFPQDANDIAATLEGHCIHDAVSDDHVEFSSIENHRHAATLGVDSLAAVVAANTTDIPWLSELVRAARRPSLVALGAAIARTTGDLDLLEQAHQKLLDPEMFDHEARVSVVPGKRSWSVSPLVAAVFAAAALEGNPNWHPRLSWESEHKLSWSGFEYDTFTDPPVWAEIDGKKFSLINCDQKQISRSLIENWTASITATSSDQGRFQISSTSYEPTSEHIGQAWEAAMRALAHADDMPLVRLLPWPGECHASVSMRYDIDRPTSAQAARDAARQQTACFGGPCGSWFHIPKTAHSDRPIALLDRLGQELGVHAVSYSDKANAKGITYHSSPDAAYWRPDAALRHSHESDAAYVEMLSRQLTRPGRVWQGDLNSGSPSAVFCTPTHFPLEGSTADTDLQYFDKLRANFEQAIKLGGHVIIGTHPDLEQSLLNNLVNRGLPNRLLWAAPIRAVVDRAQRVLEGIELIDGNSNAITIRSAAGVADLALLIDQTDGKSIRFVTNLVPDVARQISLGGSSDTDL